VFIEPLKNFEPTICDIWESRIELDDLEAIVHACHEQVVPADLRRVPLYTPDTTPNVSLLERPKGFTCVKEANFFVIAERESAKGASLRRLASHVPSHGYEMFSLWVSLDGGNPRFEATRVRTGRGVRKYF